MRKSRYPDPTVARIALCGCVLLLGACAAPSPVSPTETSQAATEPAVGATPLPTREPHPPAELVPYEAQTGDTLAAVAAHFSTSVDEILEANPGLASASDTLPPGLPLEIPAYFLPLTGSPFKILPDSELVRGPNTAAFDLRSELLAFPGFATELADYAYRIDRPAWEVIDIIATNYSINPRLLLAILEYGSSGLTNPFPDELEKTYPVGSENIRYRGMFRQLLWAAERLNDGYYGWRTGALREFETVDGMIYRPDAWQNAGTVAVQMLLAGLHTAEELERAAGPDGFSATYRKLWGDPFERAEDFIPGQLEQPALALPFVSNRIWDFTGGPHSSWGTSQPMGALDFAPPAQVAGCMPSSEWIAAPAEGLVIRSEEATIELDLDGDGYGGTGWVLFFFHVAENDLIESGTWVRPGDLLGHPSCEGGRSTGTHFHLARKYNGEWLAADGPVVFNLDGWAAKSGAVAYEGTLTKGSKVVPACTCTTFENRIIYELPGS